MEIYLDIKTKVKKFQLPQKLSVEANDFFARIFRLNPADWMEWDEFFSHPIFRDPSFDHITFETEWDTVENRGFFTRDSSVKSELTIKKKVYRSKSPIPPWEKIQKLTYKETKEEEKNKAHSVFLVYLHEKNKIIFMLETIKAIRNLMKKKQLLNSRFLLFYLVLYLIKKVILINEKISEDLVL